MATVFPEEFQWRRFQRVPRPVYLCHTAVPMYWRVLSTMCTRALYYCGNQESCCIDLKQHSEDESTGRLNQHSPAWASMSIGARPTETIALGSRRDWKVGVMYFRDQIGSRTAFVHFDEKIRRFRRQGLTCLYNGNVVEIRRLLISIRNFHFSAFGSSIYHCFAFHSDITDDPIVGVRCCHTTWFLCLSKK